MIPEGIVYYIVTGLFFGASAGLSPGPLLALVISETVRHNRKEGIRVTLTPLFTDVPILIVTLLLLSQISHYDWVLGMIALMGGVFVAHLGIESLKSKGLEVDTTMNRSDSLRKGIVVNILSPHPYLFWLTVGVPILLKAYQMGPVTALLFLLSFYAFLVGSKVCVACLVDRSRNFLKNKTYVWTMRVLGVALLIFAVLFVVDGINILKDFTNR